MNTTKPTENMTKSRLLQLIVDICIIVLFSAIILTIYENYWSAVHISQKNLLAIHFDIFSNYLSFVFLLFMVIAPNFVEYICNRKTPYKTDKKLKYTKLTRFIKIILVTVFVILIAVIFTDKYSRVEFYDNGNIIEYNKQNQTLNEYNKNILKLLNCAQTTVQEKARLIGPK